MVNFQLCVHIKKKFVDRNHDNFFPNKYLRNLVRDLSQIYDLGSNERKRVVVDGMIAKVHQRGGRFLIRQKGEQSPIVWAELPLDRTRIKVMQAFRNQRRKQVE